MENNADNAHDFTKYQDTYQETLEEYCSGRRVLMHDFIVRQLLPKIMSKANHEVTTYKVLAVGSAEGHFDSTMLNEMIKCATNEKSEFKPSKIEWTVVEPNTIAIEKFKERATKFEKMAVAVEFVWENKTFEDFVKEQGLRDCKKKYDLAEFVSCLYYMDEEFVLKETLKNLLEPTGQAFTAVGTKGDIWTKMMDEFLDKVETLRTELHYVTDKDIVKYAESYGWDHETLVCPVHVKVTDMFIENNPSGIALLKFFFHTANDPRQAVGAGVCKEFLEFLKANSYSKEDGNQLYVDDDVGFTILTNQKELK